MSCVAYGPTVGFAGSRPNVDKGDFTVHLCSGRDREVFQRLIIVALRGLASC